MKADYVVVGAGSAGCVLANRLSEDGSRVVLLEAGPRDWYPMIHVPAGVLKLLCNPLVNWNYTTDPEPGIAGRQMHWPRGRVLGGTSSINGMLWIRGNPADYDGWSQMGCQGWSFDEVLPYFKSIERYAPGEADQRGKSGPILVEDYRTTLDLTRRFVDAAQQAGIPLTKDLNGSQHEGVGYSQMSRNGRFRGSTARTFLAQARGRSNLRVETNAFATKLLFEGKHCVGVAFRQKGGDRRVMAAREVILSGGTINSPHLLQVSGVGSGEHLKSIGVAVVHDLPGVGANLSDHFAIRISHRAKDALSINELSRGMRLVGEIARWLTTGRGALTFGVSSAQAFARSREGLASPDIQLLFSPASYDQNKFGELEREPGMTIAVSIARPESRGTIMAKSPDPFARPSLKPNYLSVPNDLRVALAGVTIARRIFAAPALARHSVGEITPGPGVSAGAKIPQ
jgi:choline dehydrogenase